MAAAPAVAKPPGRVERMGQPEVSRGYSQYPDSYFDHLFFCLPPLSWAVVGQILRRTEWGPGAISREQKGREWFRREQAEWARELRITEEGLRKAIRDAKGVIEMRPVGKRNEYRVLIHQFTALPFRDTTRSGNPHPGPKAISGPKPADAWESIKQEFGEGLAERDRKRLAATKLREFSPAVMRIEVPDQATRAWIEQQMEALAEIAGAALGVGGRLEFLLPGENPQPNGCCGENAADGCPQPNSRFGEDSAGKGSGAQPNSRSGEDSAGKVSGSQPNSRSGDGPWGRVKRLLSERLRDREYEAISGTSLWEFSGGNLTVTVPSMGVRAILEGELAPIVQGAIHELRLPVARVIYISHPESPEPTDSPVPTGPRETTREEMARWLGGIPISDIGMVLPPKIEEQIWKYAKTVPWEVWTAPVCQALAQYRSGKLKFLKWGLILKVVVEGVTSYRDRHGRRSH